MRQLTVFVVLVVATACSNKKSNDRPAPATEVAGSAATPSAPATPDAPSGKKQSGTLDEIPLIDLVQLLNTSRKGGVITVVGTERTGKLYLRAGSVYFAAIDGAPDLAPLEAAYQILSWRHGTFEHDTVGDIKTDKEITVPTEELVMEAARRMDAAAKPGK